METRSAGQRLWIALAQEQPLQIAGAINAYCALLAEQAGFKALYLSGAGVANAAFGLPDLALTSLTEVAEEVRRITAVSSLPLLVDGDTGWGHAFMIARTIKEITRAGGAGLHLEDQVQAKRCGHRPGKQLVSCAEMVDRIKAAVDAKTETRFVLMARTDAYASEGQQAAIDRACAYVEAGADMIFAEALPDLDSYRCFTAAIKAPVLANSTEFGQTPLFTVEELDQAGIRLVLYPLSAFRAMSTAALIVYQTIRAQGTQKALLDSMQTRMDLYQILGYHHYEQILDTLFNSD